MLLSILAFLVVESLTQGTEDQAGVRMFGGSMNGYPTVVETWRLIGQWGTIGGEYYIQPIEIGRSTRNQAIMMLGVTRIKDSTIHDLKSQPGILLNSLLHPQQQSSLMILLHVLHNLLLSPSKQEVFLLERQVVWFIPFPNIDGTLEVQRRWRESQKPGTCISLRKNMNTGADNCASPYQSGVDLNRNFDFHFSELGTKSPCHQEYPGPFSFSENETQTIRNLFLTYDIKLVIDFHSFGNNFVYPYAFDRTDKLLRQNAGLSEYYQEIIRSKRPFGRDIDTSFNYLGYVADGVYIDWVASQGIRSFAYQFGVTFCDNATSLQQSIALSKDSVMDILVKNALFIVGKGGWEDNLFVVQAKSLGANDIEVSINWQEVGINNSQTQLVIPAFGKVKFATNKMVSLVTLEVVDGHGNFKHPLDIITQQVTASSFGLIFFVLVGTGVILLSFCIRWRRRQNYRFIANQSGSSVV